MRNLAILALLFVVSNLSAQEAAPSPATKVLSTAQLEALVEQLGADSFKAREAASVALRKQGPPAIPILQAATKSEDPEISIRAKEVLKKMPYGDWVDLLDPELSRFEVWLGIPHTSVKGLPEGTYQNDNVYIKGGKPMGLTEDQRVFKMTKQAGEPVLEITGEIHGGLTTTEEFGNYPVPWCVGGRKSGNHTGILDATPASTITATASMGGII